VNTRDKNFTAYKVKRRIEQVAEHIAGYLQDLDTADRHDGEAAEVRSGRLVEKIDRLRAQMAMLKAMEAEVEASPDGQVSLTDPDARAMATSGRGSGIVGYNVQSAVEGEHHLIVAHEVVMTGSDREQLAAMAGKAKDAMSSRYPDAALLLVRARATALMHLGASADELEDLIGEAEALAAHAADPNIPSHEVFLATLRSSPIRRTVWR